MRPELGNADGRPLSACATLADSNLKFETECLAAWNFELDECATRGGKEAFDSTFSATEVKPDCLPSVERNELVGGAEQPADLQRYLVSG